MRLVKPLIAITTAACALLALTACQTQAPPVAYTKVNPEQARLLWFNTSEGAVKCLTFQLDIPDGRSSYLALNHDCDWTTLKPGTVAGAQSLPDTTWLSVGNQEFFCLAELEDGSYGDYDANYPHYNCDWNHPKAVEARG